MCFVGINSLQVMKLQKGNQIYHSVRGRYETISNFVTAKRPNWGR